ncbi:hypothetical protein K402DRAFT_21636 [Aulographum hederae CBS 113979]|uniref:Uncharacterized protein n=1 Tax=Aulographum hederae CBS 113979 TaxID=1176131 RepID=A0A6G1H6S9_9PEZI|nr:hypothetical protein K402DRAFT_21636 [Aulographum hederae CBS 113979]
MCVHLYRTHICGHQSDPIFKTCQDVDSGFRCPHPYPQNYPKRSTAKCSDCNHRDERARNRRNISYDAYYPRQRLEPITLSFDNETTTNQPYYQPPAPQAPQVFLFQQPAPQQFAAPNWQQQQQPQFEPTMQQQDAGWLFEQQVAALNGYNQQHRENQRRQWDEQAALAAQFQEFQNIF